MRPARMIGVGRWGYTVDRCSKTLVAVHAAAQRGNSHPTAELAATAWGILAAIDLQGCDRSRLADPDRPARPVLCRLGSFLDAPPAAGNADQLAQRHRFGAVATVESAILATGHPSSCSATDPGPWTERGEGGLQVHGGRGRQTPLRLAQGVVRAALAARPSPGRSSGGGRRTGSSGAQWTGRSPTTACRLRPGYPAENARWQIHDVVGKLGEIERDGLAHRRDDERTDAKGRVARIFRTDRRRSATSTSDVKGSATSNSRWQARCTCAAPAPSRVSTSAVASAP